MIFNSIKIGSRIFKIKVVDEIGAVNINVDRCLGVCDFERGIIKVVKEAEAEIPDNRIVNSLLHEIIHAIGCVYCGDSVDEPVVESLTTGWLSILRTNSIDFKSNNFSIPEKVFIIDSFYDITYPHKSTDFQGSYISSTFGVMKIVEHYTSYTRKHDFIRLASKEILSKLCCLQELGEWTFNSLACGLIQIFEESKIVELVRE